MGLKFLSLNLNNIARGQRYNKYTLGELLLGIKKNKLIGLVGDQEIGQWYGFVYPQTNNTFIAHTPGKQ